MNKLNNMIKLYKGNPIIINKKINGRNSYFIEVSIYYRYSLFKYKVYKHKVVLNDKLTFKESYNTIKSFIDELDNIVK